MTVFSRKSQYSLAPVAVAMDSATNMIYVANGGSLFQSGCCNPGSITVVNGATNAATTIIDPNANALVAVTVNAMMDRIYFANLVSKNTTVIDGGAAATVHTLSVLFVTPQQQAEEFTRRGVASSKII